MDLYSPLLALAILGSSVAAASTFLAVAAARQSQIRRANRFRRLGRGAAFGGLGLLAAAAVSHLLMGHPPGTDRAMAPGRFASEHPMMVALAVVVALVLWRLRLPRS